MNSVRKGYGSQRLKSEAQAELFKQLLLTYESCIKSKPGLKKSRFHFRYEEELEQLAKDICHYRYHPLASSIFIVSYPKPREIIAAHIRDRVVHHFIYNYMSPYWERRFSPRSYACRKGKGPLKATQDLRSLINSYHRHTHKSLFYLKVDIASFFPTLDIDILRKIIFKKLRHPLYQYLVDVTLRHRPVDPGQFVLRSLKSRWQEIPKHKSMFYAKKTKGLPIGNLTSQFFANIYMNELDQFVTHHLKGEFLYWQRYVDDILFLSDDRDTLRTLPKIIDDYLRNHLSLRLNPSKTILQPLARGIDHLGYWIKPHHTLIRQKNVTACAGKIHQRPLLAPQPLRATLNSYFGHFRHGDSYELRKGLASQCLDHGTSDMKIVFKDDFNKMLLKPQPLHQRQRQSALRERRMVQQFKKSFKTSRQKRKRYRTPNIPYLKDWKSLDDLLKEARSIMVGES